MRRHLSYANVTATFALVVALATGGAYAADLIGSDEIRDNSIRSEDLRDRQAVKGADVRSDALGGREVNEKRLGGRQIVATAGSSGTSCELGVTFIDCELVRIRLRRAGRVLAVATGAFYAETAAATSADCELRLDGSGDPIGQNPGETSPATDSLATDGFARTAIFPRVPEGLHMVTLACREIESEAIIGTPTIVAIGLTNR